MGACQCGYTTDPEKNCNGTHNVVKAVKADLIAKLEASGHAEAAEILKAKSVCRRVWARRRRTLSYG